MMKYEHEIRNIISKTLSLTQSADAIMSDTDLQTVGMDSLSFINLVLEIENYFEVEFPDEKLIISEACSINELCNIIITAMQDP